MQFFYKLTQLLVKEVPYRCRTDLQAVVNLLTCCINSINEASMSLNRACRDVPNNLPAAVSQGGNVNLFPPIRLSDNYKEKQTQPNIWT